MVQELILYNSKACAFEQSRPYSPHASALTHSLSEEQKDNMSTVVSGRYFPAYKYVAIEPPCSTLASATSEVGLAPSCSMVPLTGSKLSMIAILKIVEPHVRLDSAILTSSQNAFFYTALVKRELPNLKLNYSSSV